MAAVTIRNLSDETHRALRRRAVEHGRSTEAEGRAILDEAIRPEGAHSLIIATRDVTPFKTAGLMVINPWL